MVARNNTWDPLYPYPASHLVISYKTVVQYYCLITLKHIVPDFTSGRPFKLAPVFFCSMGASLISGEIHQAHLVFPCISPGIGRLSQELWFLLLKMVCREQDVGVRCAYMHTHIHLCLYLSICVYIKIPRSCTDTTTFQSSLFSECQHPSLRLRNLAVMTHNTL